MFRTMLTPRRVLTKTATILTILILTGCGVIRDLQGGLGPGSSENDYPTCDILTNYEFKGRVASPPVDGSLPIEGASVTVEIVPFVGGCTPAALIPPITVLTDPSGQYSIILPQVDSQDSLLVTVSKEGYVPSIDRMSIPFGKEMRFSITQLS